MKHTNTRLLECCTCDPAGTASHRRYPDQPASFPVDANVLYVQCGICCLQGREVPRHLKAARAVEIETEQLELAGAAS